MRTALITLLGLALVAGCEKDQPAAAVAPPADKASVPAAFVLAAAPEGAQDLAALKTGGVTDGQEVTVRAVVGGSVKPFVGNRAVVQVIDPSVETCDRMKGDPCKTPWDACCHPDDAKAKGATVQVVGADGQALKGTLEGVGGLSPLKEVVVRGKARMEGGKALVIDATNVWVKG